MAVGMSWQKMGIQEIWPVACRQNCQACFKGWGRGVLTSSQKILGYFLPASQRALGAFRISCKLMMNHWVCNREQRTIKENVSSLGSGMCPIPTSRWKAVESNSPDFELTVWPYRFFNLSTPQFLCKTELVPLESCCEDCLNMCIYIYTCVRR